MPFTKAVKQVKFAKISFQGREKSGKTTTAALLAIDAIKRFYPGKPMAVQSSEPGLDYVLDICAAEGVEVLADRRPTFTALKNSIADAMSAGAGVLLIDSATTYWKELVKSYVEKNDIKKLQPFHYTPIKQKWAEFTDQFVPAKIDVIVCGRLGHEFEELEDDDGERETRRIGTKMKTEGEFNYETDLIVEMEKRDDPDAGNAVSVQKGNKKKLKRTFESHSIHIASIKGSRIWDLNGKAFIFEARDAYQVGMAAEVGKCFAPYFNFLKNGGGAGEVVVGGSSREEFANGGSEWQKKQQRQTIACEEIKGALSCVFTADTGKDAATKKEVINALFDTHSWTAVEKLDPETLEYGAKVCRRMKELAMLRMPENRHELIALVQQSKDEIHDEQVNGVPRDCATVAHADAVNEEMPF